MRFGLHSGPVTAGVLRGDKGRFQLFGDVSASGNHAVDVCAAQIGNLTFQCVPSFLQTVNTAARMESTGAPNKIHCSQATAALLEQAGKFWTKSRDDLVVAKGKGELQTHWVELGKNSSIAKSRKTASTSSGHGSSVGSVSLEIDEKEWVDVGLRVKPKITNGTLGELQEKESRLVDWYTDILCKLLWQIAAQNNVCESSASSASTIPSPLRGKVIDEVVEVIEIPELCGGRVEDANTPLSPIVVEQVRNYVQSIASRYPKNHFHNFEHVRGLGNFQQ
jgi:Adenylate and Guanylate cyclase catalytic domain